MEKNTGGVLPKGTKGPLVNLLINLSGENGDYWLDSLKKFLRREKLPEPPIDLFIQDLETRNRSKEKIKQMIQCFEAVPVVKEVKEFDEDLDIINIFVLPNLTCFVRDISEEHQQNALFCVRPNGRVIYYDDGGVDIDKIFKKWCKKEYPDLHVFYQELIRLGNLYEESIPEI